jgi:hypothetical protein
MRIAQPAVVDLLTPDCALQRLWTEFGAARGAAKDGISAVQDSEPLQMARRDGLRIARELLGPRYSVLAVQ